MKKELKKEQLKNEIPHALRAILVMNWDYPSFNCLKSFSDTLQAFILSFPPCLAALYIYTYPYTSFYPLFGLHNPR